MGKSLSVNKALIRADYIAGGTTCAKLAAKYGVSGEHVVSFNKALQSGLSPCRLSQLGREVYLRSSLLLDNVREIEAALMRFDIHPE